MGLWMCCPEMDVAAETVRWCPRYLMDFQLLFSLHEIYSYLLMWYFKYLNRWWYWDTLPWDISTPAALYNGDQMDLIHHTIWLSIWNFPFQQIPQFLRLIQVDPNRSPHIWWKTMLENNNHTIGWFVIHLHVSSSKMYEQKGGCDLMFQLKTLGMIFGKN